MTLEQAKKERKAYIFGAHYEVYMNSKISIEYDNNIFNVRHDALNMALCDDRIDISLSGHKVYIDNYHLDRDIVDNMLYTMKVVNNDLYEHMQEKFTAINSCETEDEVNDINWSYDMSQIYNIIIRPERLLLKTFITDMMHLIDDVVI